MQAQTIAIGQLVACTAYLLLTYAFFLLADKTSSASAKFAAVAFAYCGITIIAQMALSMSSELSGLVSPDPSGPNPAVYWLLFGLRPFVLLAASVLAVRFAMVEGAAAR